MAMILRAALIGFLAQIGGQQPKHAHQRAVSTTPCIRQKRPATRTAARYNAPAAIFGELVMTRAKMRTAIAAPAQGRKRERAAVTREDVRPSSLLRMCIRQPFIQQFSSHWASCRHQPAPSGGSRTSAPPEFWRPIAHCKGWRRIACFLYGMDDCAVRQAKVLLDRNFTIGSIDRRLFGAFVEHLGRCVYGGIYEPGHPTADERGFRRDVLTLVKELGPTIMQLSRRQLRLRYRWEDGVGPVGERPRRLELAWHVDRDQHVRHQRVHRLVPPRRRRADARRSISARAGRRTPPNLVEYCNHPGGTALSDLRKRAWLGQAARRQVLVPRQRDGWRLADGRQQRRGIWPARAASRQDDALGRRFDRTRRVRVVGPQHGDLRLLGRDGAGARVRPGRLDLAAHLLE